MMKIFQVKGINVYQKYMDNPLRIWSLFHNNFMMIDPAEDFITFVRYDPGEISSAVFNITVVGLRIEDVDELGYEGGNLYIVNYERNLIWIVDIGIDFLKNGVNGTI